MPVKHNLPERQRTTCRTSFTSLCWANTILLKLIWSGGLIETRHLHTNEWIGYEIRGKGSAVFLFWLAINSTPFLLKGDQRYQYRGRTRKERQTEQESRGKQAFPRITSALPGPAQFTTTKQPPRSHRGTSGQPLSSLWEQQALFGLKGKLLTPLFCHTDIFKHTFG